MIVSPEKLQPDGYYSNIPIEDAFNVLSEFNNLGYENDADTAYLLSKLIPRYRYEFTEFKLYDYKCDEYVIYEYEDFFSVLLPLEIDIILSILKVFSPETILMQQQWEHIKEKLELYQQKFTNLLDSSKDQGIILEKILFTLTLHFCKAINDVRYKTVPFLLAAIDRIPFETHLKILKATAQKFNWLSRTNSCHNDSLSCYPNDCDILRGVCFNNVIKYRYLDKA